MLFTRCISAFNSCSATSLFAILLCLGDPLLLLPGLGVFMSSVLTAGGSWISSSVSIGKSVIHSSKHYGVAIPHEILKVSLPFSLQWSWERCFYLVLYFPDLTVSRFDNILNFLKCSNSNLPASSLSDSEKLSTDLRRFRFFWPARTDDRLRPTGSFVAESSVEWEK